MTDLNLNFNAVGDAGSAALAEGLSKLTRLDLCCDAGDEGAAAIATHLPNINTLLLSECGISDEGAGAIGARLRNLSILDLSGNDITDKGLQGATGVLTKVADVRALVPPAAECHCREYLGSRETRHRPSGEVARSVAPTAALVLSVTIAGAMR